MNFKSMTSMVGTYAAMIFGKDAGSRQTAWAGAWCRRRRVKHGEIFSCR